MLAKVPIRVFFNLKGEVVDSQYEKVALTPEQVESVCRYLLCVNKGGVVYVQKSPPLTAGL